MAEAAGALSDKAAPVLLLCRSGARSRAAAIALTRAGFAQAFNIADGFEGGLNGEVFLSPNRHYSIYPVRVVERLTIVILRYSEGSTSLRAPARSFGVP